MLQIQPYLALAGRCEEALAFYAAALEGRVLELKRFAGSPMDTATLSADWKDKVLHARLECDGATVLFASDGMPGAAAPAFSGITLNIELGTDQARARRVFDALAQGGQVRMPLAPKFWGASMGMLQDRYGVSWMVSCAV